ncbi:MAG: hypothetical protein R2755_12210 [Acidimicrobiales bacterium]
MFGGDVQLVSWPQEAGLRERVAATGRLCLLVIEPNVSPPHDLGVGEDWVRSTADAVEIRSRIDRLRAANAGRLPRPGLDGDGILTYGPRWVALAPGDLPLARRLCDRFTQLVTRAELRSCYEPACSDATLAVKLHRLRRHLIDVELRLTTVRGRGCILEPAHPLASAFDASAVTA